jgi:hypothetical protein
MTQIMQKYSLDHQDTSTQAWQFASSIHFTTVVKSPGFGQGLFFGMYVLKHPGGA